MKVFHSVNEVAEELKGGVLTIGNFDGVHLGHQTLLNKVAEHHAQKKGILTFSPHPSQVLKNRDNFFYLSSDEAKIELLKNWPLDVVVLQELKASFLDYSAKDFLLKVICESLKVKDIVVGEDFRFGKDALGDVDYMRSYGQTLGLSMHVVPAFSIDNVRCSSSFIRKAIKQSDLETATKFLGRPFSIQGTVISGQKKGASLGFKTANIAFPAGCGLPCGVYASITRVDDKSFVSATNVGFRPTISSIPTLTIESHLLGVDLDLYGKKIECFFISKLRDEQKFSSVEALKAQVQSDLHHLRQMVHLHPELFHGSN